MPSTLDRKAERRRQAEQIAQRQAVILEHVHDAVVVTDMQGVFRSWNRAAERIFGWTAAEINGRRFDALLFPEERGVAREEIGTPLLDRGLHEVTLRARHKSGAEVFVALRLSLLRDESGEPIGVIGCSNDITEQKRTIEALQSARSRAEESLALLRTLFRGAPVGLAFMDRELRFVHINDAMAEINGIPAHDHLGRPLRDVLPDLAPVLDPLHRGVMDSHTPVVNVEISGETAAQPGERRHWLANYYPVEDEEAAVLGVGVVVVEITERLRAQEEIRRSERLAAIGGTLATIAHESRNELHALHLGLLVLARTVADDPEKTENVKGLLESRARLERILEELRGFAAPITLAPAACDLAVVWRRAWASLGAHDEGRSCRLVERIAARDLRCTADALRLEQVFRNLFENALAACADPVRIEASCSEFEIAGKTYLRVAVRDNGPGIDRKLRKRLFEPFFTTTPGGTGLGLAIARRIVEAHGGTLVVGDHGPGAELVMMLPRRR